MNIYVYLIKFKDGTQTVALGNHDHTNAGAAIEEVHCSEPQVIEGNETLNNLLNIVNNKLKSMEDRILH